MVFLNLTSPEPCLPGRNCSHSIVESESQDQHLGAVGGRAAGTFVLSGAGTQAQACASGSAEVKGEGAPKT